ncbi:MAG: NADH-quinone oxidoreductase subunit NuoK [Aigarchaeota archaeon]|nr:NADH-quinone oxidoreductase subunit NuoK [Aigarchaeota archaeon]MDW7986725.1 NADH-quinone oxidoreductase subunit NuoK [Nitrososphaerota archaeon]
MTLSLYYYPIFAGLIFTIGIYCLATKKSIIKQIIAIELMVNAAHLNFIAFAVTPSGIDPYAHSFVILSLGVGAAIIAVAILLAVQIYRTYGSLDVTILRRLKR